MIRIHVSSPAATTYYYRRGLKGRSLRSYIALLPSISRPFSSVSVKLWDRWLGLDAVGLPVIHSLEDEGRHHKGVLQITRTSIPVLAASPTRGYHCGPDRYTVPPDRLMRTPDGISITTLYPARHHLAHLRRVHPCSTAKSTIVWHC